MISARDLAKKYVQAFPFSHFHVTRNGQWLFFLWQKEGRSFLSRLSLQDHRQTTLDLRQGERVCEEDFSKGSFWIHDFDSDREQLYFVDDDRNREAYRLNRLNLRTGQVLRLTPENESAEGFTLSKDFRFAWGRFKKRNEDGTFTSRVVQLDLLNEEILPLFSDEGWVDRIGWSAITKVTDEEKLVFTVDYLSRRKKTNVFVWDLKSRFGQKLLPEWMEDVGQPSAWDPAPQKKKLWLNSEHEGFENIYELDLQSGELKNLTGLHQKNDGLLVVEKESGREILTSLSTPGETGSILRVYDQLGGYRDHRLPGPAAVYKTDQDYWVIVSSSDQARTLIQLEEGSFQEKRRVSLAAGPASEIEHTKTQWVNYKSFDGLSIPALLHRPKGQLKAALVVAFYGGEDHYNSLYQMFAELGVAILSPAVRGSWGWGPEWTRKLEGDLGGAEILDVIWGAQWLQKELQLPQAKIGVYGSSHGGYATLRAMTMPSPHRGVEFSNPFGFGIAEAGFADLEAFFRDSRIADWLVHLLGPYQAELYAERSPIRHFERLQAPLLVINGTNDTRVPFSTISAWIERLKNSNRPHRILIHEGQGHHAGTEDSKVLDRATMVEFLQDFVLNHKT